MSRAGCTDRRSSSHPVARLRSPERRSVLPTRPEEVSSPTDEILLDVRDLHVDYAMHSGALVRLFGRAAGYVRAVDGVSFQLRRGEVLGLVGESGSGKTTLGRALLGLVKPSSVSIRYAGVDLATQKESELRS